MGCRVRVEGEAGFQVDSFVSSEGQSFEDDLCAFFRPEGDDRYFSALFLFELYSLFEGVLFVRVDDMLNVCRVYRLSIWRNLDSRSSVWDPADAYDYVQCSATLLRLENSGLDKVWRLQITGSFG